MHFHLATLDDLETWAKFRAGIYHDIDSDFNFEEIKSIVENPVHTTFLVFENEADVKSKNAIGMVELSLRNVVDGCLTSPVAYIEGLYLVEAFQGKGLGKEMITFIKKWAAENGCSELAVDAELENERAQKFYQREGFEETCRVVQFKMGLKNHKS